MEPFKRAVAAEPSGATPSAFGAKSERVSVSSTTSGKTTVLSSAGRLASESSLSERRSPGFASLAASGAAERGSADGGITTIAGSCACGGSRKSHAAPAAIPTGTSREKSSRRLRRERVIAREHSSDEACPLPSLPDSVIGGGGEPHGSARSRSSLERPRSPYYRGDS